MSTRGIPSLPPTNTTDNPVATLVGPIGVDFCPELSAASVQGQRRKGEDEGQGATQATGTGQSNGNGGTPPALSLTGSSGAASRSKVSSPGAADRQAALAVLMER